MKVSRRATFNAAHRLFRPDWTNEKNVEIFGKCSNPNFHGHNYVLEVILDGEIDESINYLIDFSWGSKYIPPSLLFFFGKFIIKFLQHFIDIKTGIHFYLHLF